MQPHGLAATCHIHIVHIAEKVNYTFSRGYILKKLGILIHGCIIIVRMAILVALAQACICFIKTDFYF